MRERSIQQDINHVIDAFNLVAYWSMAGVICVEAINEHGEQAFASFSPDNGIWQKLAKAASEQLDLEEWLS